MYKYPHPAVPTDCVIIGNEPKEGLSVFVIMRGIEPFMSCWAFTGGFIRMDENAVNISENPIYQCNKAVAGIPKHCAEKKEI